MPEAIPDLVRCPDCGAGNPAGTDWCGQCLRRFDGEHEPPPRALAPVPPAEGRPEVRAREGAEPVWTCPACEAENPLSASICGRCGSQLTSFFGGSRVDEPPRRSGPVSIALSALLPGAGHWSFRRGAPGVARALLYVWSVGISIMLLGWPPRGARALVRGIGAVFALAGAGVWLVSLLETMRFTEGDDRPLIPPKALTWFTAGLSGLLMVGLLGAVIAGR